MTRKLFDKLETWVVVTVITVLIWLYAEGAIVETYTRQKVTIQFVGAGDVPVAIEPAVVTPLVTFRASGPTFQKFKERTDSAPITIPLQPGDENLQTVDIADRLEQEVFNELGIVLDEADPETEDVSVRRLVEVRVPITVRDSEVELERPPAIEPNTVTFTVPEDLAPRLSRQSAYVDLNDAIRNNPPEPGVQDQQTLAIEWPDGIETRWTKADAEEALVTYRIEKVDATLTVPTVPLELLVPTDFPFDIRTENNERVINNVEVTGPSDTLERIAAGELEIQAVLRFKNIAELSEGRQTVDVTFITPPGVTTALQQQTVILKRRTAEPSNGTNGN